jgi:predicted Zn-dependent protease
LRNRINPTSPALQDTLDIPLCWIQFDLTRSSQLTSPACAEYQQARSDASSLSEQLAAWKQLWAFYPGHPYLLFRASEWMRAHDTLPDTFHHQWQQQAELTPDSWLVALAALSLNEQQRITFTDTEQARWRQTLLQGAPSQDQSSWSLLSRLYDNDIDRAISLRAQAQLRWLVADVTGAIRIMRRAIELGGAGSQRTEWESILRDWERSVAS